jgi:outer membrane protein OmpA-like peptidoglycan-associated protein
MKYCKINSGFRPHTIILTIVLFGCVSLVSFGQTKYNKENKRYQKTKYKNSIVDPSKVCSSLSKSKKAQKRGGKVDLSETQNASTQIVAYIKEQRQKQAQEKDFHHKSFQEMNLDERHQIEDEVLAKNKLPVPTSKKHEEIRRKVANELTKHKDGSPIELAPLYFTFDEDEFSVVDMEPFLIAVEYALQGKMVLIEGHTDARGSDAYNRQLSMKRVERIRQLMHDMGVPDDQISVVGYGEEMASTKVKSEDDHQLSRRVDFKVF